LPPTGDGVLDGGPEAVVPSCGRAPGRFCLDCANALIFACISCERLPPARILDSVGLAAGLLALFTIPRCVEDGVIVAVIRVSEEARKDGSRPVMPFDTASSDVEDATDEESSDSVGDVGLSAKSFESSGALEVVSIWDAIILRELSAADMRR
jgi:hypothetical protein